MDPILLLALFALGGLGWWWYQRRQPPPVEDEWVLPPASVAPGLTPLDQPITADGPAPVDATPARPDVQRPRGYGADRVVLDRDALLRRDRTFDPRNWDNSPDGGSGGEAVEGDLPRFFDRDYLEQKARDRDARTADDA